MMQFIVILATVVAVGTVLKGFYALKTGKTGSIKKAMVQSLSLFSIPILGMFAFLILQNPVLAEEAAATAADAVNQTSQGMKYLGAALSTGLATIGTGFAVGSVGSSAIGAVSEDSSILGKTLIFVGMAEGIAIYGVIISILILFV